MDSSDDGRVVSLHLNVGHRQPLQAVERASFLAGQGIEGDRHCTPTAERRGFQVLLIEAETLNSLDLSPGAVRENVTTAGIDLSALPAGSRLSMGSQVVLQISKPCAPCSRMDEVRPGLQEELEGRRGMLASVEAGGSVHIGDTTRLLSDEES
jgi:hypothetical protein